MILSRLGQKTQEGRNLELLEVAIFVVSFHSVCFSGSPQPTRNFYIKTEKISLICNSTTFKLYSPIYVAQSKQLQKVYCSFALLKTKYIHFNVAVLKLL